MVIAKKNVLIIFAFGENGGANNVLIHESAGLKRRIFYLSE
jgi:hypothetical protein